MFIKLISKITQTTFLIVLIKYTKYFSALVIILVSFFISAYVSLYAYVVSMTKCNITAGKEDVLIFAAHCDDAVIMAGGYAIQITKSGGKVKIVYLTGSDVRLQEAYDAWGVIGLGKEDITCLRFDNNVNLTLTDSQNKIGIITKLIEEFNPSIIFTSIYEGGHRDHDITNYLVSEAVKSLKANILIYECPEYNYYFSFKNTPEKFLDVFSKVIPLFQYHSPPSFIDPSNALYLCMSEEEIETKKNMLRKFITQRPNTLITHFGCNDRFQRYTVHNYYLPPHDYGSKIVYMARYSKIRFLRRFFRRPYWKLYTIYSYEDRLPLSGLLER